MTAPYWSDSRSGPQKYHGWSSVSPHFSPTVNLRVSRCPPFSLSYRRSHKCIIYILYLSIYLSIYLYIYIYWVLFMCVCVRIWMHIMHIYIQYLYIYTYLSVLCMLYHIPIDPSKNAGFPGGLRCRDGGLFRHTWRKLNTRGGWSVFQGFPWGFNGFSSDFQADLMYFHGISMGILMV